jgi:glycosyltransferase involved in cell wall biosynthesis
LPEICGAGALYASPYDVNDIRNKIEKLLSDRPLRDQLVEKGRENAQRFSKENYQKRLKAAYLKALNRG